MKGVVLFVPTLTLYIARCSCAYTLLIESKARQRGWIEFTERHVCLFVIGTAVGTRLLLLAYVHARVQCLGRKSVGGITWLITRGRDCYLGKAW
jgi:hypothetical protein